jgi:serine/threonine-protein kinase
VQALEPGQVLNDRYSVVRKIGSGGFGSVYLVEDKTVNDELILKILSPHICQDETVIKRFMHELKYTRRITHKNVIRLFDFIEMAGVHAISMEYFPGQDLSRLIRKTGPLGAARTVTIARQICEGLAAAHQEGIIHRDIKPPNVLVNDDGVVKIVDFGLASMAHNPGSQLTRSGIIIGTPQYMAPEQITGDKTDARTDLYALGIVMFEMLTGAQPYQAENAVNILFQHLEAPIPSIRERAAGVPEELEAIVWRVMAKDREQRPESAQELFELLSALSTQPVDE